MCHTTEQPQDIPHSSQKGNGVLSTRMRTISALVMIAVIIGTVLNTQVGYARPASKGIRHAKEVISTTTSNAPERGLASGTTTTIGAYYYPWYTNNFRDGTAYLRSKLSPKQEPLIGQYDDTKQATISSHLAYSQQAGIGLWVTSWFGPRDRTDLTTQMIMEHPNIGAHQIAINYESVARMNGLSGTQAQILANVQNDILYMCEKYFGSDNYYKIDGRPVLVVYATQSLDNIALLKTTVVLMRAAADECDVGLYLIGDYAHGLAPAPEPGSLAAIPGEGGSNNGADFPTKARLAMQYFDAVTNYDVYGSMARVGVFSQTKPQTNAPYIGRTGVNMYYEQQLLWRDFARLHGCQFVPAATPGYNARAVTGGTGVILPRRLSSITNEGSMFTLSMERAMEIADNSPKGLVLVNSFNNWQQDTQIEPVRAVDGSFNSTSQPQAMTDDVKYKSYNGLYLDIIAKALA